MYSYTKEILVLNENILFCWRIFLRQNKFCLKFLFPPPRVLELCVTNPLHNSYIPIHEGSRGIRDCTKKKVDISDNFGGRVLKSYIHHKAQGSLGTSSKNCSFCISVKDSKKGHRDCTKNGSFCISERESKGSLRTAAKNGRFCISVRERKGSLGTTA